MCQRCVDQALFPAPGNLISISVAWYKLGQWWTKNFFVQFFVEHETHVLNVTKVSVVSGSVNSPQCSIKTIVTRNKDKMSSSHGHHLPPSSQLLQSTEHFLLVQQRRVHIPSFYTSSDWFHPSMCWMPSSRIIHRRSTIEILSPGDRDQEKNSAFTIHQPNIKDGFYSSLRCA